ncbi:beta-N-acetylhexosaminidase [Streptomyces sp. 3N207]|uniref:beta-N-acetylhexosaminidase n=1 Tax=Streptomyces sp. 3N207 TaxID=3457417 RepID=UPI003FD3FD4D
MSALVPRVVSEVADVGEGFVWGSGTALRVAPGTEGVATWLRGWAPREEGGGGSVDLSLDEGLASEAYRLDIAADHIRLVGGSAAGVFWAAQTLRQLLPPRVYRRAGAWGPWRLAPVRIDDEPRFAWRGFMLDVARHFMPKDGVLRVIDQLAAHKLNVLHFHLTDDQGWRLEITRHPRLTEVGAWRAGTQVGHRASTLWDARPHGGYYTHDDIREIVAYAAERHITVVPEIDIPGHSSAAIASYPELGCTDVADTADLEVPGHWGMNLHLLSPSDATLRFYEEVLEEVLDLFPSPFICVGGDECKKDQWRESATAQARISAEGLADEDALQGWFMRHFDRWLAVRGRRLMGWDEILEGGVLEDDFPGGGLTEGAAVLSWRGYDGGITAARAGHDVVICPEHELYLDRRQDESADEPMPLGYVQTLRDVYHFEPLPPELAGTPEARHVRGVQANLWSECTESQQRVDYQVFPRLAAVAEVAWSPLEPAAERDFADFERRLDEAHYARLDAMGVDYRPPSGPRPWQRRPGIPGRPR